MPKPSKTEIAAQLAALQAKLAECDGGVIAKGHWEAQLARGEVTVGRERFERYWARYLRHAKGEMTQGSWEDVRAHGSKRLLPYLTGMLMNKIDLAVVRDWRASMLEAVEAGEWAPKTVNNARVALLGCCRASGVAWTVLRNGFYADRAADSAQGVAVTGTLLTNTGDGRASYVARADCAAVAAEVLLSADHDGHVLDVTGSEAIAATDQAVLIGQIIGRPIEVVQVDDETYATALIERARVPAPLAQLAAGIGASIRLGYAGTVATTITDVTARRPTTLNAVLETALTPASA